MHPAHHRTALRGRQHAKRHQSSRTKKMHDTQKNALQTEQPLSRLAEYATVGTCACAGSAASKLAGAQVAPVVGPAGAHDVAFGLRRVEHTGPLQGL